MIAGLSLAAVYGQMQSALTFLAGTDPGINLRDVPVLATNVFGEQMPLDGAALHYVACAEHGRHARVVLTAATYYALHPHALRVLVDIPVIDHEAAERMSGDRDAIAGMITSGMFTIVQSIPARGVPS